MPILLFQMHSNMKLYGNLLRRNIRLRYIDLTTCINNFSLLMEEFLLIKDSRHNRNNVQSLCIFH